MQKGHKNKTFTMISRKNMWKISHPSGFDVFGSEQDIYFSLWATIYILYFSFTAMLDFRFTANKNRVCLRFLYLICPWFVYRFLWQGYFCLKLWLCCIQGLEKGRRKEKDRATSRFMQQKKKRDNNSLLKFSLSGSGQKHQRRNDDVNSSNEVDAFI